LSRSRWRKEAGEEAKVRVNALSSSKSFCLVHRIPTSLETGYLAGLANK
jgi:hypothetical protein